MEIKENTIEQRKKIFEQMKQSAIELGEMEKNDDVPTFTPPETEDSEFNINEFGEIERPQQR